MGEVRVAPSVDWSPRATAADRAMNEEARRSSVPAGGLLGSMEGEPGKACDSIVFLAPPPALSSSSSCSAPLLCCGLSPISAIHAASQLWPGVPIPAPAPWPSWLGYPRSPLASSTAP